MIVAHPAGQSPETYLNGNIFVFRKLYHELNKNTRKDFTDFLLSEVEPIYWREILKQRQLIKTTAI